MEKKGCNCSKEKRKNCREKKAGVKEKAKREEKETETPGSKRWNSQK